MTLTVDEHRKLQELQLTLQQLDSVKPLRATADYAADRCSQLDQFKFRFQELKKQFLLQESKKRLLEWVSGSQAALISQKALDIPQLEAHVQQLELNLTSMANENLRMHSDISAICGKIDREGENINRTVDEITSLQSRLEHMKTKLNDLVNVQQVFKRPTLHELQPRVEKQSVDKSTMEQAFLQKSSERDTLQSSLAEQQANVNEMMQVVRKLEAKAKAGRESVEQRLAKQRAIAEWYRCASQIISSVFGFEMAIVQDRCSVILAFQPAGLNCQVQVEIFLDEETAKVMSAETKGRRYPLDDIVKEGKSKNDLVWLVHRIHQRVSTFARREMEVRELEEIGWPMKLNLEQYPDCVGVELRDKTIMIQMDREYPELFDSKQPVPGRFRLAAVMPDGDPSAKSVCKLMQSPAADPFMKLSDVLSYLSSQPW